MIDHRGNGNAISIQSELQRVLSSHTFRRASRMRVLLKYLVNGRLEGVKVTEARVASEVLGKGADFDSGVDPEVRVHVGRLRRKLAEYYATEGKEASMQIDLPARTYDPVFLSMSSGSGPSEDKHKTVFPSVAVLPFSNLTNDPARDAFCYGLTDEIITSLAAIPNVNVVGSSSAFQYKDKAVDIREAGHELGVQTIIEGSVRIEDGRTRVAVRMARAEDGIAIWADSFDAKAEGTLSTQQLIANEITESLPAEPLGRQA
jgi:TolB-like protein